MRIRLLTSLALIASLTLGFNMAHAADSNYDVIKVQAWDVPSDLPVIDALPAFSDIKAPATVATYGKPVSVAWVDTPRVFRDFRTIADSGGRRV